MNRILKLLAVALATTLTLSALAQPARFSTKNDGGNSSGGAEVIFPAHPGTQTRIVNVLYQSDTNNAQLSFTAGTAAYSTLYTNAASSSVTNSVNVTNGLAASSIVVLQHLGVCYPASISSVGSNTTQGAFVVLASGGFGVSSSVNDPVYLMSSATTIPVGQTTNALSGFSVFAADNPGRPVRVVLTPALSTNRLNSVTAVYE